jgi:hypothetical protein
LIYKGAKLINTGDLPLKLSRIGLYI